MISDEMRLRPRRRIKSRQRQATDSLPRIISPIYAFVFREALTKSESAISDKKSTIYGDINSSYEVAESAKV